MTAHGSTLRIRVDDATKEQAAAALAEAGLSLPEAVRLFLRRVAAEKRVPVELEIPNAETRAAMAEADEIARTHRARFATEGAPPADVEKACDE
jgi:DNA-damage-inducible protein J